MINRLFRHVLFLLLALCLPFSLSAQETALPQNYMMEKHGIAEPFYCDLEDPIEELACMAWDAALGALKGANDDQVTELFPYYYSISALNLVQQVASSARYNYYASSASLISGGLEKVKLCIPYKYGMCGHHKVIMKLLLDMANIQNREVDIYYTFNGVKTGHSTVEFYASGKWNFMDISFGAIWLSEKGDIKSMYDLESIIDLRQSQRTDSLYKNMIDPWLLTKRAFNYDHYLNAEKINITYDREGIIEIELQEDDPLLSKPNYVGTIYETNTGITMRWSVPDRGQTLNLRLDVAGIGGCSSNGAILLDDGGNEYPLEKGSNQITVTNGGSFNVKRDQDEICYIVFSDIALLN